MRDRENEIIKLISLTADSASCKKEIEGIKVDTLVSLELPWWHPGEGSCPFCTTGVKLIKYGEDQRFVPPQITPYEFYEFVYKTKALVWGNLTMATGNKYRYIIDTSKIFDKLGMWFAKIFKENLKHIIDKIDYIVCPEDYNRAAVFLSLCLSNLLKGSSCFQGRFKCLEISGY